MGEVCQHILRSTLCARWHGIGWSTHVEINFQSSLALVRVDQHILMYDLCPCYIRVVKSTHVEMHFVSSLPWDGFG